jgi:hypothetical protein
MSAALPLRRLRPLKTESRILDADESCRILLEKMNRPFPEVIVGPETKRIDEALSKRPRPKSITAEEAKRQVELHLESARRNLLMADHKIRPRL